MSKAKRGGWKPWFQRGGLRNVTEKRNPLMSMNVSENRENSAIEESTFTLKPEPGCPYKAWKLYFPKKKYEESTKIQRIIIVMIKHFKTHKHWYDFETVTSNYVLYLHLEKFCEDDSVNEKWEDWYDDFLENPSDTLEAIALALHTIVEKDVVEKDEDYMPLRKLFVRPIGWRPVTPLKDTLDSDGKLVSTNGIVQSIGVVEANVRYLCFQCKSCSGMLCVEQSLDSDKMVLPSKCVKGCKKRSGFIPVMSSPYSIISPKQRMKVREVSYQREDIGTLEVELTEDQVSSVWAGSQVIITGVIVYTHNQINERDAKQFKPHFQCYSVVCKKGPDLEMYKHIRNNEVPEIVNIIRNEPNIFRTLVRSFCPDIFGREEAKAACLLALISGNGLYGTRRSDSHVLLLGNPGTGKSKLLLTAAMISPRGMFASGSLSTAVGMTMSLQPDGTVEAGVLPLSDDGDCCIDELDKLSAPLVLLEAMEQQEVSIAKCGVASTLSTCCSILAAANPVHSIYDRSKTLMQNARLPPQLFSRFDVIVPFIENIETNTRKFTDFMMNRSTAGGEARSTSDSRFFENNDDDDNFLPIPPRQLKDYIEFVKQTFHPRLTDEAKVELHKFYTEFSELCKGCDQFEYYVPTRFIESLIRLTLSRARAEMVMEATLEHVNDVLWLMRYSAIDIYDRNEHSTSQVKVSQFPVIKRRDNSENIKAMSKPKQMKAFMEFLTSKCDEEGRNSFTTAEMKAFASEVGVREFDDIVFKLNYEGSLLKTADGYRVA